jgi:hypothetical protein
LFEPPDIMQQACQHGDTRLLTVEFQCGGELAHLVGDPNGVVFLQSQGWLGRRVCRSE